MYEDLKKDINNIVWWIPFKKLRNSVRNIMLSNLEISKNIEISNKAINISNENNLLCPICGYSAKEFLTFGVYPRKNAQCPKCKSLERHRLYYLYLLRKIDASKQINVCHFAPEKSIRDTFNLFKNIEI